MPLCIVIDGTTCSGMPFLKKSGLFTWTAFAEISGGVDAGLSVASYVGIGPRRTTGSCEKFPASHEKLKLSIRQVPVYCHLMTFLQEAFRIWYPEIKWISGTLRDTISSRIYLLSLLVLADDSTSVYTKYFLSAKLRDRLSVHNCNVEIPIAQNSLYA